MSPDATYTIQFRADQNDPINTYALGLNDTTIHVATPKRMVAQIADSNAFTFRVTSNSGVTEVWSFKAGEAKRALADVIKECPVNRCRTGRLRLEHSEKQRSIYQAAGLMYL